MGIKKLPKIELHCHLDGSVRPNTLLELSKEKELDLKYNSFEEFKELVQVKGNCENLDEYLEKFDIANEVMQNEKNLKRITFELMEDVVSDNVKYIEIRFAPLLHINEGLTFDQVVGSVIEGMKEAEKKYEINGNIILSCMRTMSVEDAFYVVKEGEKFLGKGVVAIDLASSENKGFVKKFKEPINLAEQLGYRITIHAGETGIGENVLEAIREMNAERIGHGVYSKDCPEAYELLKERGVTLEMCPTSNLQTKAVKNMNEHPVRSYFDDGINITINTDNMTVSDTTTNKEYEIIKNEKAFTDEEFKTIYKNSVEASFASEEVKEKLRKYI